MYNAPHMNDAGVNDALEQRYTAAIVLSAALDEDPSAISAGELALLRELLARISRVDELLDSRGEYVRPCPRVPDSTRPDRAAAAARP